MGKSFMLITYGTVWDFSLPHWQLTSWSMDFCMTQAVSLEVRFLLGLDLRFFKISCQNDKRIIGIKFWSVWYQIIEVQLDSCAHGQLTCDDNFFQKSLVIGRFGQMYVPSLGYEFGLQRIRVVWTAPYSSLSQIFNFS